MYKKIAALSSFSLLLLACASPDNNSIDGALNGQVLTGNASNETYFDGSYTYPLTENIPVNVTTAPLVVLNKSYMLRLVARGKGYAKDSAFKVKVSADNRGTPMELWVTSDNRGSISSAKIIDEGKGFSNQQILTIPGGDAMIQLSEFGLFVTANTPFELGSVPKTRPKIGGEHSSDKGKWLGGDASFSFQLASSDETGGKELYYMGFSDTFIGDYQGVPFNTWYGRRGTEAYFINNSFALYDLNKFTSSSATGGWKVPKDKDLSDTIQYYWSYTDVYDFNRREHSSEYGTLPVSFFQDPEHPSWQLWQMSGLRVRGESKFIAMAYNNKSHDDLTTVISVNTHKKWNTPFIDGRKQQWDISYHQLPETLSQVKSSSFPEGRGYVAWTTSLVYGDGTVDIAGTDNTAYMVGKTGDDNIVARVNLAQMADGNFDHIELWVEPGLWVNHKLSADKNTQAIITNTGGLNTGAGFYFNRTQQRWYTWVIPFLAKEGVRQYGTNFIQLYRSTSADITSSYEYFKSVYKLPDPTNEGHQLNPVTWFPYNVTVHPQLHENPDKTLPLIYNVNYGSLSQNARGGASLFQAGGDAAYRPIVIGNEFLDQ